MLTKQFYQLEMQQNLNVHKHRKHFHIKLCSHKIFPVIPVTHYNIAIAADNICRMFIELVTGQLTSATSFPTG